MFTKTDDAVNGCIFQWKIQNISHCWLKQGEGLLSPFFIADALEHTKWSLNLYPNGRVGENYMSIYLHREEDCSGPDVIEINYQIVFLDKNGLILKGRTEYNDTFKKRDNWGFPKILARERVFVTQRKAFLPEDTLTIQCKLWRKDRSYGKSQHLFARTVYRVNRRSFIWTIKEFSTLKPGFRNKFQEAVLDFDLVLHEVNFEKYLSIDGILFHKNLKYFSFKTFIIDSDGEKEFCGTNEYFADDLEHEFLPTLICIDKVLDNKSRYLRNDALTLEIEYVFSAGSILYELYGCDTISLQLLNESMEEKRKEAKLPPSLNLANQLKYMYNNEIFSDLELRTKTQSFPVHKLILYARSPAFRKIFNDIRFINCKHIVIHDLEDHIVRQMLLYLYTDTLEDLVLENACKLYVAADKYKIISLKIKCSDFIKNNLCITKACGIFALACLYDDFYLKSDVQDFIVDNAKEIIISQDWKRFKNKHPKLAKDVILMIERSLISMV